jgi:hypothetical protein
MPLNTVAHTDFPDITDVLWMVLWISYFSDPKRTVECFYALKSSMGITCLENQLSLIP